MNLMRTLIVDRFEGNFAVCEEMQPETGKAKPAHKGKELHFYGIDKTGLPEQVKVGDVLHISDDGVITVDAAQTKTRRDILNEKQKLLKK